MVEIRKLEPQFWVSAQLGPDDMAELAKAGVTTVVNNRPDGEAPDQPRDRDLQEAAQAAGLVYRSIAFRGMDARPEQARALAELVSASAGPVLAFCQSGMRSTVLWAGMKMGLGGSFDEVAAPAAAAGYDLGKRRSVVQSLAGTPAPSTGRAAWTRAFFYWPHVVVLLTLLAVIYLFMS